MAADRLDEIRAHLECELRDVENAVPYAGEWIEDVRYLLAELAHRDAVLQEIAKLDCHTHGWDACNCDAIRRIIAREAPE